uniref:Uncharacterized protein n=1 Tax=Oryza meridionalis TaxID=40149 RepID=A0A0E0CZM0_9ORYZ
MVFQAGRPLPKLQNVKCECLIHRNIGQSTQVKTSPISKQRPSRESATQTTRPPWTVAVPHFRRPRTPAAPPPDCLVGGGGGEAS